MCYDAAEARDAAREERRPRTFRRGVVRLRALQSDVSRSLRHARRSRPRTRRTAPTVFATHSTHKLLAALSQTSYIHIRDGRGAIDHGRFNEAYCTQASTSPLYALIASNDVAAAMMDGPGGQALTQETIDEAVACRLAVARARQEFLAKKDWFFAPWNAEASARSEERQARAVPRGAGRTAGHRPELLGPASGRELAWLRRPAGRLVHARSDQVRHRLPRHEGRTASSTRTGIPADIVTAYLGRHGIVPSRTTDHMVLFLFSMGVTKGKWGTLLNTLLDFKVDYDRNAPLAEVLPGDRRNGHPSAMPAWASRISATRCGQHLRKSQQGHWQAQAYATLAQARDDAAPRIPALMAGDAEKVPLAKMAGRVVAVGVIPYPPGIPIVMPGENIGRADGPWLTYLRTLQEYGHRFPGFAKEVEGAEEHEGGLPACTASRRTRAHRRRRGNMIEYAARTPKIPIPFHRLLKVVALVDGEQSAGPALLDRLARRELRGRDQRSLRSRRLRRRRRRRIHRRRSTASSANRRASSRKPCAASDFARRSGRWRIRSRICRHCPCSE